MAREPFVELVKKLYKEREDVSHLERINYVRFHLERSITFGGNALSFSPSFIDKIVTNT